MVFSFAVRIQPDVSILFIIIFSANLWHSSRPYIKLVRKNVMITKIENSSSLN